MGIEQWQQIKAAFADHEAWLAEKAGTRVEGIGLERLQSILSSPARMELEALIARDLELSEQVDSFDKVARLTYFTRDLMILLNNFVTFYDFYSQKRKAIFQAGTLYLDGRACELCVRVDDMDAHQVLATLSRTYLVYCQCRRRNSEEQMTIAAAFTNGDARKAFKLMSGVCGSQKSEKNYFKILRNVCAYAYFKIQNQFKFRGYRAAQISALKFTCDSRVFSTVRAQNLSKNHSALRLKFARDFA